MRDGDTIGQSQEELQASIYAVHVDLRKKFKESIPHQHQDGFVEPVDKTAWDDIWKEHTGNKESLQNYAEAMHELATRIWDPRNVQNKNQSGGGDSKREIKCRIEWVVSKCQSYFTEELKTGKRLRLLDVGSCYNPFSKYENLFDILAIDLCPAPGFEKSVFQADFLEIQINENPQTTQDFELKHNSNCELVSLVGNRFDLIVFSFFLEYLPSPAQRLESCQRAHRLLRPSGLLFILRPDSNSVTASTMKLIKEMKVGMGLIGFKRISCEKLEHLWCTVFVKLNEEERQDFLESSGFKRDLSKIIKFVDLAQLFCIPQDLKLKSLEKAEEFVQQTEVEVETDPALFDELPNSI